MSDRIFIVEDEALISMELRDRLEKHGYVITGTAARGEDAIELIAEEPPELVLMDVKLAGSLDGVEAAGRIRERHDVPVIFLTAYADDDLLERARQVSPYGYLVKPFDERSLRATIEMALHRSRLERRVRESERRYRTLAETANDHIFVTNPEGAIVYMNGLAARSVGLGQDEVIGKSLEELFPSPSASRMRENLNAVLNSGERMSLEEELSFPGGTIWFSTILSPLRDERGTVTAVMGISRDISDRKRAEEEIATNAAIQSAVNDILRISLGSRNLPSILSEALSAILSVQGLAFEDRGAIFLADGEQRSLTMSAERNMPETLKSLCRKVPVGWCLCGRAASSRDVLFSWSTDECHENRYQGMEPHGHYCVPVVREGTVLGLLNVYVRPGAERSGFAERFLLAAADTLANVIARRRVEDSLREHERKYRVVVENIHEIIYQISLGDDPLRSAVSFIGGRTEVITGHEPAEFIADPSLWSKMIHPEDFASLASATMLCITERRAVVRLYRLNVASRSAPIWIEDTIVPEIDAAGAVVGYYGVARDITERKLSEEALHAATIRLNEAQRLARMGSWERDLVTNRITWSAELYRMFDLEPGNAPADLDGYLEIIHPEDREGFLRTVEHTIEKGLHYNTEYRIIRKNGTSATIHAIGEVVRDAAGRPVLLRGTAQDVTEQRRLESRLRESEKKYRDLFESATDAVFILGLDGHFIDVNRTAYERLGYTREELLAKHISTLDPPEFAARVPERFAMLQERGRAVFESAHLRKDGTAMPVEINSRLMLYEGKQVFFSIIRDITERKRADDLIRQQFGIQSVIDTVLYYSLGKRSLTDILLHALEQTLSVPWLAFDSAGCIMLADNDARELRIAAHVNMPASFLDECRSVPFGNCLCGRVAMTKQLLFLDHLDEQHEIVHPDLGDHGHYCIPIQTEDDLLGVMSLHVRPGYERRELDERFLTAVADALAGIIRRKQAEADREKLVDDLRRALAVVSRSQKEWMTTFDGIGDMISIHDRNCRVIKANKAFADYVGLTPKEVVNRYCHELMHGAGCPVDRCPFEETMQTMEAAIEEILDPRTKRVLRIATYPYHGTSGELAGAIHIARDITEERQQEERLILSERLASLGQMASGIAHEINNPLASIAGCSEGLLSRIRTDRYERDIFESYLNIIQEEVFRCKNITTSMLSFVRKSTYEKSDVDLRVLLERTLEIIGFQGRLKQVEVRKEIAADPLLVRASEGELRQVILVIIVNALDAMGDKGVLTVMAKPQADGIIVQIADNGPGIPDEQQPRIFDPFFTTKQDKGGTGLGLSIARRIIVNHNGTIDVKSSPEQGTAFTIFLPQ